MAAIAAAAAAAAAAAPPASVCCWAGQAVSIPNHQEVGPWDVERAESGSLEEDQKEGGHW